MLLKYIGDIFEFLITEPLPNRYVLPGLVGALLSKIDSPSPTYLKNSMLVLAIRIILMEPRRFFSCMNFAPARFSGSSVSDDIYIR